MGCDGENRDGIAERGRGRERSDQKRKQRADAAAENDQNAQALELLKAGKPAEAEPLLNAVAEDRETSAANELRSADNEKKAAAAAYRNLASIASVSSPGRAREYYAKAAQLDPENAEGVFWNGWYQFEAGKLSAAQAAYEPVVSIGDTKWIYWARNGLGDILVDPGAWRAH